MGIYILKNIFWQCLGKVVKNPQTVNSLPIWKAKMLSKSSE